jgi:hypothetical protein
MKRTYSKPSLFDSRQLGTLLFAGFVIFVALRILTPPNDELMRAESPDSSRTARLRRYFYYDNQPSYKIDYRKTGKKVWLGLYRLPAYTNIPPETAAPELAWSDDSARLDFLMNGTSIWHHVFQNDQ